MWSETFEKWLTLVTEHYGSLEAFTDAPTIRIHLGTARRRMRELVQFLNHTENSLPAEDILPWRVEHKRICDIERTLAGWLHDRGLPE